MKKIAFLVFLLSLGAANLHADDQTATVQQELKDQGFYYGQVDGQGGPETTAAIRRYQIRNGLQVDGTLNKETLDSLKVAGSGNTGAAQPATAGNPPVPPKPAPLVTQQPQTTPPAAQQDVAQSDKEFLRKQDGAVAAPQPSSTQDDNSNPNTNVVAAPVVVQTPPQEAAPQAPPLGVQFVALFARTPYQNAPLEVQQDTLRTAQAVLARQTFYNGEVDGIPGPATARAIVMFQNNAGLAQTARLDLETLGALRLLPNERPMQRRVIIQPFYPAPPRYYAPQPPPRVYRGNWYD